MIKRVLTILAVVLFGFMLARLATSLEPMKDLTPLAQHYVEEAPDELGTPNVVTAVVVTYRGLDTLGEVTVLFLSTAGVGYLLAQRERKGNRQRRRASELLRSGAAFLVPFLVLFGVFIFVHGHLTPGGGFQGGVLIASAMLLILLSEANAVLNHTLLAWVESLSGAAYVVLGLLGLLLAGTAAGAFDGFLNNTFLPLGRYGALLSAGAIPLIYSVIGLKVGAELTGILDRLRGE